MRLARLERELREETAAWRRPGMTVGFVPTMGALHEGHASLVRRARGECDRVAVSVFVNPAQFGPGEDLDRYPRELERDLRLLDGEGADLVFAPEPGTIYPEGFCTFVEVAGLTSGLCGASRPGHFRGVATVCCVLFRMFEPTRSYFGEKDFQQLVVVRRMASDLRLGTEIVACPTVRETDGLAMSSRNSYLSPEEREQAALIHRGLDRASEACLEGCTDVNEIKERFMEAVSGGGLLSVSYLEAVDPSTLEPRRFIDRPLRLLTAVYAGRTRLIDNIELAPPAFSRRNRC
jgi:pantoate--beta-alanine ligase